jgi:hypothetical protein
MVERYKANGYVLGNHWGGGEGAIINVTKITTIVFEDKDFINKEIESHFIGELTDEQAEFLTIILD